MSLVFVIEDEPIMAEVIAMAAEGIGIDSPEGSDGDPGLNVRIFNDAVSAMEGLREEVPDVILLDVMLTGPDGFAFLNEMISYDDTMRIPVILISTIDLTGEDLSHYGVVKILDKTVMMPEEIRAATKEALISPSADPVAAPALAPVVQQAQLPVPQSTEAPQLVESPQPAEVAQSDPETPVLAAESAQSEPQITVPTSMADLQEKLRSLSDDAE